MAINTSNGKRLSLGEVVKLMPEGKFLQMNDVIFYVLSCKRDGKSDRRWITMEIRELLNEEISIILIGWNHSDSTPNYAVTYMTKTRRPGATKLNYRYSLKVKDPVFRMLDLDLRIGLYKGAYICKDLKNGDEYSFAYSTKQIKEELSKVSVGDIVSVCKFQGFDFFIASYRYGKYPHIKKYDTAERVILKRGMSFKWISTQIGRPYEVRKIWYNQQAEKEYPMKSCLPIEVCEEVKASYGFATGFVQDGSKVAVFTDILNYKSYSMPIYTVHEDDYKALCKHMYIIKAYISTSGSYQAYMDKAFDTLELGTLEYLFSDKNVAFCMDIETCDVFEIPMRYMPNGIKKGKRVFCITAKDEELKAVDSTGRIYVVNKI